MTPYLPTPGLRPSLAPRPWQVLAGTLVMLLALLFLFSSSACLPFARPPDPLSPTVPQRSGRATKVQACLSFPIGTPPEVPEGSTVERRLSAFYDKGDYGPTQYEWTPPRGATNVRVQGGVPYEQKGDTITIVDVPATGGQAAEVTVTYNAPALPASQSHGWTVETLTVTGREGDADTATFHTKVVQAGSGRSSPRARAAAGRSPARAAARVAAPGDPYWLWEARLRFAAEDAPMDADEWARWRAFLTDDEVFVALRAPLRPSLHAEDEGAHPGIAFHGPYSPTIQLVEVDEWGDPRTVHAALPLHYRPELFGWLEERDASSPDEVWVALGASAADAVDPPAGLDLAPGAWRMHLVVWFDCGGGPDDGLERMAPFYLCFGDPTAGGETQCLGPQPVRLRRVGTPDPPFVLYETAFQVVTPTQEVACYHAIRNLGDDPVTVNLVATSTLDLDLRVVAGDAASPAQRETPLVGPQYLDEQFSMANTLHFWVLGAVPADAPDGPVTIWVRAGNAEDSGDTTWTTDLLWVGDFPPESQAPTPLHLPLVVR